MIYYPAQFVEDYDDDPLSGSHGDIIGLVVTFRDVPEAITQGDTFEDALDMAEDALRTAMEFYDEDGKTYPAPSEPQHGDVMIALIKE